MTAKKQPTANSLQPTKNNKDLKCPHCGAPMQSRPHGLICPAGCIRDNTKCPVCSSPMKGKKCLNQCKKEQESEKGIK